MAYQLVFQDLTMAAGGRTMIETGTVRLESFNGYPIVISEQLPTSTGDLSKAGTLGDRRVVTVILA